MSLLTTEAEQAAEAAEEAEASAVTVGLLAGAACERLSLPLHAAVYLWVCLPWFGLGTPTYLSALALAFLLLSIRYASTGRARAATGKVPLGALQAFVVRALVPHMRLLVLWPILLVLRGAIA